MLQKYVDYINSKHNANIKIIPVVHEQINYSPLHSLWHAIQKINPHSDVKIFVQFGDDYLIDSDMIIKEMFGSDFQSLCVDTKPNISGNFGIVTYNKKDLHIIDIQRSNIDITRDGDCIHHKTKNNYKHGIMCGLMKITIELIEYGIEHNYNSIGETLKNYSKHVKFVKVIETESKFYTIGDPDNYKRTFLFLSNK